MNKQILSLFAKMAAVIALLTMNLSVIPLSYGDSLSRTQDRATKRFDSSRGDAKPAVSITDPELISKLRKALELRQSIRDWLFQNGTRLSKELIAEARSKISGSGSVGFFLFFVSCGSHFSGEHEQKVYRPLLSGGEFFVLRDLGPKALKFAQDCKNFRQQVNLSFPYYFRKACTQIEPFAQTPNFKDVDDRLKQFRATMKELELLLTEKPDARLQAQYETLRDWAVGSSVEVLTLELIGDVELKRSTSIFGRDDVVLHVGYDDPCHVADEQTKVRCVFEQDTAVSLRQLQIY